MDETPMTTATPITMPKHGQRRAQLVAADRLRRHAEDFAEFVFAHHKRLSNFAIE